MTKLFQFGNCATSATMEVAPAHLAEATLAEAG